MANFRSGIGQNLSADTLWDAAGDVAYATADATGAILTIGSTDEVLTVADGLPSWAAAGGGGATTREGGNTTEATTTSTSAVDLLSATSLTIAATEPFQLTACARKTTGASGRGILGWKENATVVWDAATGASSPGLYRTSITEQAENGSVDNRFSSRVTNYLSGKATGNFQSYTAAGVYVEGQFTLWHGGTDGDTVVHGTDEITSFIIRGEIADSDITLGVDEMHIYSFAIS